MGTLRILTCWYKFVWGSSLILTPNTSVFRKCRDITEIGVSAKIWFPYSMFRVGILRCQGTGTLRIMMLASLTIFLLLSINTINCIASQNNSRSKTTEDVGGSTTSNGNEGRIIILILFNRWMKPICWLIDLVLRFVNVYVV